MDQDYVNVPNSLIKANDYYISCSKFHIPKSRLAQLGCNLAKYRVLHICQKEQTSFLFSLLTRSSTKLLAPFPDSVTQAASGGSTHSSVVFLCSNQGIGCPPFSARQQFSPCGSLVLSRWNSVCCMVFPEFSRLFESTTQLLSFWIWGAK